MPQWLRLACSSLMLAAAACTSTLSSPPPVRSAAAEATTPLAEAPPAEIESNATESPTATPSAQPREPLPERALKVGFLIVDGVYNTELMAPYDVFHHTVFHTKPGMEVFTVSPDGQAVETFEGIELLPHYSFATAPPIDVLVVPSAEGSMTKDLENQAMIDWVRTTARGARWVVSLCDGAFVLAQAGLLDGLPATTFPGDYEPFAERFPHIDLRINVSLVRAGKVITSQGGARSYQAAMHLVEHLYGLRVAQGVGRGLLIPWPPGSEPEPPIAVEGPAR